METGRTGVFEIGEFYKRFIGFNHVPESLREWQAIPEENLAAATNGKVFVDPVGAFTAFRDNLKAFYPEDVRLKKIASRCMTMAQSGQYNYARCMRREEYVAARLAEAQLYQRHDLYGISFKQTIQAFLQMDAQGHERAARPRGCRLHAFA